MGITAVVSSLPSFSLSEAAARNGRKALLSWLRLTPTVILVNEPRELEEWAGNVRLMVPSIRPIKLLALVQIAARQPGGLVAIAHPWAVIKEELRAGLDKAASVANGPWIAAAPAYEECHVAASAEVARFEPRHELGVIVAPVSTWRLIAGSLDSNVTWSGTLRELAAVPGNAKVACGLLPGELAILPNEV